VSDGGGHPHGPFGIVVEKFERFVVVALIGMMMIVVALSTIELAWIIVRDITTPPILLLEVDELLEIFGFFLLILIGVELLETIKAYLRDNVVHVEIVLEVALIAIARKVVVLDTAKYDGVTILAIAALIVALATAFLLERRARRRGPPWSVAADPPPGPQADALADPGHPPGPQASPAPAPAQPAAPPPPAADAPAREPLVAPGADPAPPARGGSDPADP
jgi:uncharacterized membrane protein (DUF373 family)